MHGVCSLRKRRVSTASSAVSFIGRTPRRGQGKPAVVEELPDCVRVGSQNPAWLGDRPRMGRATRAGKRPDGRPLHPEWVLNHFHDLTDQAGVPRCTLHDLRHLAISEGVNLRAASQTARHSTISTTTNIYAHLTRRTARQAVDAIASALNREERRNDHTTTTAPRAA